ncbi:N-acetyltransferase, partial [Bacteroides thetaiotaomicron]
YTTYNMVVIKMTYNAAFDRRITRNELIEQVGLSADYWGFFQLTDEQFNNIISRGKINESIIID